MKDEKDSRVQRRALLTGMGAAAAGVCLTGTASGAEAGGFQPARHEQDAWLAELPGSHRSFVDSDAANGGAAALHYARNILNAHRDAYGGEDSDTAMIVCFRHFSTVFGFGDEVWKKYGEAFHARLNFPDPLTGKAPDVNLMRTTDHGMMPNLGATIDSLLPRGVQFAICSQATKSFARGVAQASGGNADDIYNEFVASAIPNSRFVPAGVMTVMRAQEYGYGYLFAG